MNGLLLRDRAPSWCTAASVVVVGMGLVSAPVDVDRPVLRSELHAGVVLESAETGLGALASAAAFTPVVRSVSASAPKPSANVTASAGSCGIEFVWTCGLLGFLALPALGLFLLIDYASNLPQFSLDAVPAILQPLVGAVTAIQSWVQQVTDSIKAFVSTIFPPSASARAVSTPVAARRSSADGVAAATTVSAAVANHAAAQASSAAGALPARSLERTAAPHRRGGVPAAAAHRSPSPHAAAAARPARAATGSVAHAAVATPRNQQFRSG